MNSIPLLNDPAAATLTGKSYTMDSQIVNFGVSDPGNQSPAALHLASVHDPLWQRMGIWGN